MMLDDKRIDFQNCQHADLECYAWNANVTADL